MAKNSALTTLIELATADVDEAAKRLGAAIRHQEEAKQKYEMLLQYRDDYAARFQASMMQGVTAAGHRNFTQFMGKLDAAIEGQKQIVAGAGKRVEAEQQAWQECERKRMTFDTLATRAARAEEQRQNKRDQKLMDELAARKALQKQN